MKKFFLFFAIVCVFKNVTAQQVFMQGWYWDYPKTAAGKSWADTLRLKAPQLKQAGITHLWFPPHAVASFGTNSNGYDPKDLFIGNQTTGLGTRPALNAMLAAFTANNIAPVADLIYNHRDGGTAEINPPVKEYITNQYNASKNPYPSDRYFCVLPIGGSTLNGAGDYFIKFSSKSGDARFNGKGYKIYMTTSLTSFNGVINETEPNGGFDCTQGNNAIELGKDVLGTIETTGGCGTDEFRLSIAANQFNPSGDSVFIYLTATTGGYSDFRVYGLFSSTRGSTNFVNEILYKTFTNYSNLQSGRGQMNYEFFKPNSNNVTTTGLNNSFDEFAFFYDYDQFQKQTQDTLIAYTKWNYDELGVRGIRMDAVKQFTPQFVGRMLDSMHSAGKDPSLVVGEFFDTNPALLKGWVDEVNNNMSAPAKAAIQPKVFDFTLREQLRNACDNNAYDVRNIFNNSAHNATGLSGFNIITFANNHDFREASGFNSLIRNNNDLAYAYMLTNNQLGVPTIFYPDYYGYPAPTGGLYSYHPTNLPPLKNKIDSLIIVLKSFINGSPSVEYLNRFSTPFSGVFYGGATSSQVLLYQLSGTAANGNRDVIVAINFSNNTLGVRQKINNRAGAIQDQTRFYDFFKYSSDEYIEVNSSQEVSINLAPKSYTVFIQNSASVLPVKLMSFNALPSGNDVLLNWKIENETNTANYAIERSVDAINFTKQYTINATNNAVKNYSKKDSNVPKISTLYYRLKITEKNGNVSYSNVVKVVFGKIDFNATINPNPVTGDSFTLTIQQNTAKKIEVSIVNAVGQQVKKLMLGNVNGFTNYNINIAGVAKGNYTIIVNDGFNKINKQLIRN